MIYDSMRFYRDGKIAVATVTQDMLREAGAEEDDLDDLAALAGRCESSLLNITIREKENGTCRVSVRSGPEVNSCDICAVFGGGGHAMAAGCTVSGTPGACARAAGRRGGRGLAMNGILLIDKEPGWTSSDVVVKLKGILHERRIGHAGTLDPMATGLLVVFVGRATRAVEFAEHDAKRYLASLRLGITTDTQDITGNILERKPVRIGQGRAGAALARFRGEQQQIPPMYSAIRVKGRHLYDIARKGGEVERAPRAPSRSVS